MMSCLINDDVCLDDDVVSVICDITSLIDDIVCLIDDGMCLVDDIMYLIDRNLFVVGFNKQQHEQGWTVNVCVSSVKPDVSELRCSCSPLILHNNST